VIRTGSCRQLLGPLERGLYQHRTTQREETYTYTDAQKKMQKRDPNIV